MSFLSNQCFIFREKPDIVFLQEVTPITYSYLEEKLPYYQFFAGGEENYFTATLLCVYSTYLDDMKLHPFSNTSMGRNILEVKV